MTEKTAIHEAGHILAGELLRHRVGSVTIEAGDGWNGSAHFEQVPEIDLERVAENPHALVAAAGMAAEGLVFGRHYWGGSVGTTESLKDAEPGTYIVPDDYFSLKENDGSDLSNLCLLAAAMGFTDPEAIEHRVEAWISEAADLLASYRAQLTDLTAALLERRTLSGREVREIIYEEHLPPGVHAGF